MPRDVEADVVINDKSSKGLGAFLASLKRSSDGAKNLQRDADRASNTLGKMAGKTDANSRAFAKLNNELQISKRELGSLAAAFANAGTAAERLDISKAIRRQQTEIRNLSKNADILGALIPDDPPQVKKLSARLKEGLEEVAAAAPRILGGGVVAAAPLIAATLSAAVIGGVGLGGIGGGIALVAKDAQVVSAFADLKTEIGAQLKDAAAPFVETTVDGIGQVKTALAGIDFDGIFANSARNARPIFAGVATAIAEIGSAVDHVIDTSGPVLDQLGDTIGDLGRETAEFLEVIGGGSGGAAAGLKDVTSFLGLVLDITGPVIRGLTEVYGWLSKIGVTGPFLASLLGPIGQLAYFLQDDAGAAELFNSKIRSAGEATAQASSAAQAGVIQYDQYGLAILSTGEAITTFTDKINSLATAGRSLFDTTTQVAAATANLKKSIQENGKTLDENTEKGRANRDALSELAGKMVEQYNASVRVNGEGAKSNAVAASNRESFIRLATALTGSKQKAADLATELGLLPVKKDIKVNANTHDAEARAKALRDSIASIKSKTVVITLARRVTGSSASDSALESALRKQGFDATARFQAAAGGTTRAEPARATLAERLDNYVTVQLDGRTIYSTTERQVRQASARDAWRQRVGKQ